MNFMDLLKEWLDLKDRNNREEDNRPIYQQGYDRERMEVLEYELNNFFTTKQS